MFDRGDEKTSKSNCNTRVHKTTNTAEKEGEREANYCVYSFGSLNVLREPGRRERMGQDDGGAIRDWEKGAGALSFRRFSF